MLKNCHVFRFIDDLMQRVTVGNLKIITNNAKLQVKGLILKIFDSHPYREREEWHSYFCYGNALQVN